MSETDLVFLPRSDDLKARSTFSTPAVPIFQFETADIHKAVLPIDVLPDEFF